MRDNFCVGSELKSRCDPCQPGGVFPHIVEFGNLGGGVAQKVGHLTGREGSDAAIRLFDSVDQRSGESVAERVEALQHEDVGGCLLVDMLSVAPGAKGFFLEAFDFRGRKGRYRFKCGPVFLALADHEVGFFDHGCRQHGIFGNEFLLGQIAEVICQQIVDFFHGGVGISLTHPVIQHTLDIRRDNVPHDLAADQRVNLVLGGTLQPVIGTKNIPIMSYSALQQLT